MMAHPTPHLRPSPPRPPLPPPHHRRHPPSGSPLHFATGRPAHARSPLHHPGHPHPPDRRSRSGSPLAPDPWTARTPLPVAGLHRPQTPWTARPPACRPRAASAASRPPPTCRPRTSIAAPAACRRPTTRALHRSRLLAMGIPQRGRLSPCGTYPPAPPARPERHFPAARLPTREEPQREVASAPWSGRADREAAERGEAHHWALRTSRAGPGAAVRARSAPGSVKRQNGPRSAERGGAHPWHCGPAEPTLERLYAPQATQAA
jgi:hypothetical protein